MKPTVKIAVTELLKINTRIKVMENLMLRETLIVMIVAAITFFGAVFAHADLVDDVGSDGSTTGMITW